MDIQQAKTVVKKRFPEVKITQVGETIELHGKSAQTIRFSIEKRLLNIFDMEFFKTIDESYLIGRSYHTVGLDVIVTVSI